MNRPPVRVTSDWLALREEADAAARSRALVGELIATLSAPRDSPSLRVHDLASGTGSMARWLAPLLPGPQHWLLHDLDEDLLAVAAATPPGPSAHGAAVTFESRTTDIMRLGTEDLAPADLVTASALLDMMTARELTDLVVACAALRCPVLIGLSVVGRVAISPADPLDRRIASAFNAHQRRSTTRGDLLGPDAATFTAAAFRAHGFQVRREPSPWRLGAADAQLVAKWFEGWFSAALEHEPGLRAEAALYGAERRAQAEAGLLGVNVGHVDLLALPPLSPAQNAETARSAGARRRRSDAPPPVLLADRGSTGSARR
jgi:hypothetical protein